MVAMTPAHSLVKKKKNPLPVNDAVRVSVAALGLPTWG